VEKSEREKGMMREIFLWDTGEEKRINKGRRERRHVFRRVRNVG